MIVISGATTGDAPRPSSPASSSCSCPSSARRWARATSSTADAAAGEREIEPTIGQTLPLSDARAGFDAMLAGDLRGKIVFTV